MSSSLVPHSRARPYWSTLYVSLWDNSMWKASPFCLWEVRGRKGSDFASLNVLGFNNGSEISVSSMLRNSIVFHLRAYILWDFAHMVGSQKTEGLCLKVCGCFRDGSLLEISAPVQINWGSWWTKSRLWQNRVLTCSQIQIRAILDVASRGLLKI